MKKHYYVGNIKFNITELKIRTQTKWACYFFKYIRRFITGLCLFAPAEERIAGETSPFPGSRLKAMQPNVTLTSRNTTRKQTAKFSKPVSRPHLQTLLRQQFWASSKGDNALPAWETATNSTFGKKKFVLCLERTMLTKWCLTEGILGSFFQPFFVLNSTNPDSAASLLNVTPPESHISQKIKDGRSSYITGVMCQVHVT